MKRGQSHFFEPFTFCHSERSEESLIVDVIPEDLKNATELLSQKWRYLEDTTQVVRI